MSQDQHQPLARVVLMLFTMLAIPAALTLRTVLVPGTLDLPTDDPTPQGYTWSLLLFINWRAFSLTSFFVVLISLLWAVTLALPYGRWGFEAEMMIGLTIAACSRLPIEEVSLWSAVTFTTVVVFEVIKIRQASGLGFLEALLGMRAIDP